MFGYKYKADAMKWRAHEKEKMEAMVNQKWSMVVSVKLANGAFLNKTFEREGYIKYYYGDNTPHPYTGKDKLEGVWSQVKEEVASKGFEHKGKFYPHSQIAYVCKGDIEVVK